MGAIHNLQTALVEKYSVGQVITAYPYSTKANLGTFFRTSDGLEALLHVSAYPPLLTSILDDLQRNRTYLTLKITRFDKFKTGKVAVEILEEDTRIAHIESVATIAIPETSAKEYNGVPDAQPEEQSLESLLEEEYTDILRFLESTLKQPLSEIAKNRLRKLLSQHSIFRFTYEMQTAVDMFEPDVGIQLLQTIQNAMLSLEQAHS